MRTLGLFQNIDSNRRRSVILIVGAIVFLMLVGAALGLSTDVTPWAGMAVALVVGIVLTLVAWKQGSSIVLKAVGAREIAKREDPELVNVVEEMCIASGLPRPKIHLIDSSATNAFASGMKPEESVVAITRGLREQLSRDELQGVIAHELAHIGNLDSRVMVLMAVIVGSVAILCDWYLRSMRFSGRGRGKGSAIFLVLAILFAILAPLIAVMIQFAVSRRREYLADATAAAMTRNPGALADALEKLAGTRQRLEAANRGTQHLFIVNPFRQRQERSSAFATHPPLADRIRRLRAIAGRYAQRA
ncbi:MAG: M48 family metallopeptidase [Planctomycetota bacterium]|jgi:heat shock protein HtpX